MKNYIFALFLSFFSAVICGVISIPLLKKLKMGQTILKYVEEHKSKNGTPTMGGLFFIIPSSLIYIILNGFDNVISLLCLTITLAYMVVGFLDDFIKIKLKRNEGLKPYQKIVFQLIIAVIAGVFVYKYSLYYYYIPYSFLKVNLGKYSILLTIFIFLAITNSVNLTDGLDGLAGGTCLSYLIGIGLLIFLEYEKSSFISEEEGQAIMSLIACFGGGILGFLMFNVSRASVFMGDTGSLGLGGLIGSVSILSGNSLIIPILGIMFVVSSISVLIQVAYYKKTKKRVFLMAPYHHHLQHKGYSETKISFAYSMITFFIGLSLVIVYL